MTVYTRTQAERMLDAVLTAASEQGEVRIQGDDGRQFVLRPATTAPDRSPLDIPGVDLHLTADEIVRAVRESRER